MAHLVIENLTYTYADTKAPAVSDISLELSSGEILALIGGSGSGKSTLLRCIAGLEQPRIGKILLADEALTTPRSMVPPERRKVGMVSQSGDLFPHLTVLKNTTYGLHRLPRRERRDKALDALSKVGLDGIANRYPAELSGGEAQRVALARALAYEPELILLDEPFSNLDAVLRDHLRGLTLEVLRSRKISTVFVTHHADDALAAGDRIAVMRHGELVQWDTPRKLWRSPADAGIAALFGGVNVLPGDHPTRPRCLRPEELRLCSGDQANCLACGTVERVDYLGSYQHVLLRIPDSEQLVRVRVEPDHAVQPGTIFGIDQHPETVSSSTTS